jgi:hypothetical protein
MPALAKKPLPQVDPTDFDRWRAARTEPAQSVVGYTPLDQLYEDYIAWAEEALGHDAPDPLSFRAAFDNAPKPFIRFETLWCRAYYQRPRMADCASLTLRAPIGAAR